MNSNVIFIVAIACMAVFISSCYSMNIFDSNDDSFDMLHQRSNYENVTFDVVKRHEHENCVHCKFGVFRCCEPNICVKRTLRPDKCMRIKAGK
jgi:hypothetical protein